MKYKELYRETRPEVFDEILGQESIVKILRHQVATDTVSHAYLFTGTRGTGKTTTARILAKAVNCEAPDVSGRPCGKCDACRQIADGTFVDVIEIDAASNNGVDNIRELRESVNYPPAVGRVKVYIIDEVHMLSTGAFNALLKTLEEPPENVIFILATTNPEKLPQTVLSRCMRLDFKRVPQNVLAQHMKDICSDRGVEIDEDALRLLAANADGSVRDSLSILEQCLSSGEQRLTRNLVLDFLGAVSEEFYLELTEHVMSGDISSAFVLIDRAVSDGKDVKQIMKDWMSHCRNLLIAKYVSDPRDLLNLSTENIERLRQQAAGISLAEIDRAIITLAKAISDSRYSTQARILLEVAVVSIASGTEYGEAPDVPVRQVAPAAVHQNPVRSDDQNPVGPEHWQDPARTDGQNQVAPAAVHQNPVSPEHRQSEYAPERPQEQAAAPVLEPAEPQIKTYTPDLEPVDEVGSAQGRDAETAQDRKPSEAPAPEQTAPAASYEPSASAKSPEELADIWRDVCREAAASKPLLNILFDCVPAEQKGDEIKLIVNTTMTKQFAERDAVYINSLLNKYGVDGHIVCVLDTADAPIQDRTKMEHGGFDESGVGQESDLEKARREVSEILGIDVTLEE